VNDITGSNRWPSRQWRWRALRISTSVGAALVALWALAPPIQAYLDPGTGSTLVQGVIGSVAIAAGLVSYYWRRVRNFFSGAAPFDQERGHDG
jgi:hypothetical protein